jgi:hypothetical protein
MGYYGIISEFVVLEKEFFGVRNSSMLIS